MGYASATMKGIWKHMRAVDLVASLAEVDPERIGAIGHSLGGHNAIFAAVAATAITCRQARWTKVSVDAGDRRPQPVRRQIASPSAPLPSNGRGESCRTAA